MPLTGLPFAFFVAPAFLPPVLAGGFTFTGCTTTAPCGEGDCIPDPDTEGINTCNDDTATFFVRVLRTDGAESCDGFVLELSNGLYVAP